jgi:hypothetical protein
VAKEVVRIYRVNDSGGQVSIEVEVFGNRYLAKSWPSETEFLAQAQQQWSNNYFEAAAMLALWCYLAVDPTGSDPALLNDVALEIDPAALTIVRRSAAL